MGQLDKITAAINVTGFNDNGNYIIDLGYDSLGRVSTTAYPNITATLEYNARGYLSRIKDGTTALQTFMDIDAFGNVVEETFENGIKTARQYDLNTGRLTSIETGLAAAPRAVQDLLYAWRSNRTLLTRTDERDAGTDYVETFGYDTLNRMKKATTSNWNRVLDNSFDDFGNLGSKTSNVSGDMDATGFSYASSGKPHRLTNVSIDSVSNTINYDNNGSIIKYDAVSGDDTYIGYSVANRVIKITVGNSATDTTPTARDEFWYGPDGQRFLRKATWMNGGVLKTGWTLYLMGGGFEEVHPEYNAGVDYVQRAQLSASVQHRFTQTASSGTTASIDYIHRDHLGSIDTITDENGAIYRKLSFDPFGGRRESDWSGDADTATMSTVNSDADSVTGRGFTGHEHLNRTGFIHMNGRVFDPRIGRFLRADPIVQSPGIGLSYNRYSYTSNNPLSAIDPTGFEEDDSQDDEDEPIDEVISYGVRLRGNSGGGFFGQFWSPGGGWYNGFGGPSGGRTASQLVPITDDVIRATEPEENGDCGTEPDADMAERREHIRDGAIVGGISLGIAGGFIVANIVGFPEVEFVEGAGLLMLLAGGGDAASAVFFGGVLPGAVYGATIGGAGGAALPTNPDCVGGGGGW